MITNSVMIAAVSLVLLVAGFLEVARIASLHQSMQHEVESKAIGLAQLAYSREISSKNLCVLLKLEPTHKLTSCTIGQKWVEIEVSQSVDVFGRSSIIRAKSRVGFGFYSQNLN